MKNLTLRATPTQRSDDRVKTLYIVGAGFSHYAGLPLASAFTQALLDVDRLKMTGPSRRLVELIRHFVQVTFDHGPKAAAKYWPELEDLFTCIDLSANTGHHLGPRYSPADLRTVRRALLVRIIRMLPQKYKHAEKGKSPGWMQLENFLMDINPKNSAFLSMNWDVVIERGLQDIHGVADIDYCCGAAPARFDTGQLRQLPTLKAQAKVLKPHGSINWLYCDACRRLFWVPPLASQTDKVASQLFRARDWDRVAALTGTSHKPAEGVPCPACAGDSLGTRFATFSYRKALDFPMHSKTWQAAEELLCAAEHWVFIGYSLPAADYEFKHLLKRVQLTRHVPPKIYLITGGDTAEATRVNYQKFFGPTLALRHNKAFLNGLDEAAMEGLRKSGCFGSA